MLGVAGSRVRIYTVPDYRISGPARDGRWARSAMLGGYRCKVMGSLGVSIDYAVRSARGGGGRSDVQKVKKLETIVVPSIPRENRHSCNRVHVSGIHQVEPIERVPSSVGPAKGRLGIQFLTPGYS